MEGIFTWVGVVIAAIVIALLVVAMVLDLAMKAAFSLYI